MTTEGSQALHDHLRRVRDRGRSIAFSVVGAGHGGMAMAAHLGLMGFGVRLYNRTDERLNAVRWHGGIEVSGEVEGFAPIRTATADMAVAIEDADVIMVVTPANAHAPLAELMAPHLRDGQIVVLNPGRTGGALEFRGILAACRASASVLLAETQTFLYASRSVGPAASHVYRIKNRVALATLPAYWVPDVLAVVRVAFPQFVPGSNVLSTSLENIGAVFHPALTLLNGGWIEATRGDFDYYLDGITPSVAKVLEAIDRERVAVADALGIRTMSAREWLYLTYDSAGRDLHEAIHHTHSYAGIRAPRDIAHRYITEDVPMSLVPLSSLGGMLGVSTPAIDMVIQLASLMHGRDYRAEGRTVERLGLTGMSVREIRQLVVGIEEERRPAT